MIESSVLCSSNWDSDIFTDFSAISEVSPIFDIHDYTLDGDITTPECLTPNEKSSSDYEDAFADLDLFSLSDGFISEILESSVCREEEKTNVNAGFFSDLDYLNSDSSKKRDTPKEKCFEVDELCVKHKDIKDPFECLASTKLWSKMQPAEQLETLHALSDIVTYHFGIREQMEIIKILDPTAIISPDDKEFALDSTFLNDLKLRRIKEFVRKQKKLNSQKPPSKSSFSSLVSSKKASNSKLLSRKKESYSRTKRRQKKNKTTSDEPISVKRLKQTRKEKKSGFFVYEKKMKLVNPLEEDEDVNILE